MLASSINQFRLGLFLIVASMAICLTATAQAEQGGPFAAVSPEANLARYNPKVHATGTFKIRGSDTMYPVLSRLVTEFQRRQPNVTIEVKPFGSNPAIEEFLQPPLHKTGKVMLSEEVPKQFTLTATSRELFDTEIKEFVSQHGYEPIAVPVAVDAVAVYVHKDNPIAGLTLEQVDAMFSTTRLRGHKTAITQWGQLELPDTWNNAPIQLYGRDRKSGTRSFFKDHGLGGGEFVPSLHENPGAASVILSLSRDQLGVGYSGLGLQGSMVRAVPLAETAGMPFVPPSSATVADQTYPLRRVLYLYVNKSPKAPLPPAAQEFLAYIMSHEGQEAVIKAGFFPLPLNQVQKNAVALGGSPEAAPLMR
ncbi:phosphate-binding protein PstS [Nitrospira sp. KM1]|uniref:PstS family phosphate ABC transporter substrate-binding protein n=1 Tax=Nitrospira sp. KM1 TaxID=1936990 RepID=UPI0013A79A3D|nr:PstS family phosphate ABC transporter substrate-binding protein [Nitrospira sp. KM1]BCA52898.1 phosphate-binding protein PstS [Nitrospira sp. KM1]